MTKIDIVTPSITEADMQALAQQDTITRRLDAAVQSVVGQSVVLAEATGQLQAFHFMHKVSGIGHIKLLADIKEQKLYKGATVKTVTGELISVNTFEDYCLAIGFSRSKVDEDIQNLNVLGEEYLESAQRLGLGYRQLRKLRALPEEDRQLVIEGEKVGNDAEALKDLLEELAAKRAKDREALVEQKKNYEALEKVASDKDKKLTAANVKLAKLETLTPDEQILAQAEVERNALAALHTAGFELLGTYGRYLAQARAVLDLKDVAPATVGTVTALVSGMCSKIAESILEAGIDIDFRIITYPLSLGDLPLRGDGPDAGGD